jgi:hypothetical protein
MNINIYYKKNNNNYLLTLLDCDFIKLVNNLNSLEQKNCKILEIKHINK